MYLIRRPWSLLTIIAALVSSLSVNTNTLAKEVDADLPIGGIGGAVHADPFTGMATTSVPIAVPPGRNGIQPNLALTYASSSGNGWVGMGWKLELGAIERQTRFGVDYSKKGYSSQPGGKSVWQMNSAGRRSPSRRLASGVSGSGMI